MYTETNDLAAIEMRNESTTAQEVKEARAIGDEVTERLAREELAATAMHSECATVRRFCRSALARRETTSAATCTILPFRER